MSDLYSDVASFGQFTSKFRLILTVLVFCILVGSAYILYTSPHPRTQQVEANVLEPPVCNITNSDGSCVTSNTRVNYNINDKDYNNVVNVYQDNFKKGDKIVIKYNPDNPNDISYKEPDAQSTKSFGMTISGLATLLLVGTFIWYYLTQKYKPIAAFEGVNTAIDATNYLTDKLFRRN
jgi:hypothetical protein